MKKFLRGSAPNIGLLILRVFVGTFLLLGHGYPKFQSFTDKFHTFPDPLGIGHELSYLLATGAEFLCSILVILGLYTRIAVIPIIITMSIAAFVVHAGQGWGKYELALLYGVVFLVLLFTGPGKYSLDHQVL